MSEFPFHAFIELITVDQDIVTIDATISTLTHQIVQFKKDQDLINKQLDLLKNDAHLAKKQVDTYELEIKTLDQQEKTKKERLENATDHKQYQALKKEIDTLKRKQHDLESVVLNAWSVLEVAQKEAEQYTQEHTLKSADLTKNIEQKTEEIAVLQAQRDEQLKIRAVKEPRVPQEWLEKYAIMRSRVQDPVVPVHQKSCSACYYNIPEQDLMMLKRRKLLQCKSCYRLLYAQEFETETPNQTIE